MFNGIGDLLIALATFLTATSGVAAIVAARISGRVRFCERQIDAYATNFGIMRRALLEAGIPVPALVPIPQPKGAQDAPAPTRTTAGAVAHQPAAADPPDPADLGAARHRRA